MPNPVFTNSEISIFETMSRLAVQHGSINLGQGFPEGLEPAPLIEAAIQSLRDGPHQYPPMMGLPALRQAVADNARRFFGLQIDWEKEVLVTSGATEALAASLLALLDTGDEVIILEPAYDSYAPIIRRAGAIPVPVRLLPPSWDLPREQLLSAITGKTRAILLNNPTNPTGKVFSADELAFLAELIEENDLLAISDEVYDHLVFDGQRHVSLFSIAGIRERVVRIGSAGKSFSLTGWKVGYVTADAKLLRPITNAHQYINFSTPPALQTAVAAGLQLPDAYFQELRQSLQTRRNFLSAGLRAAGLNALTPPGTYFVITDLGTDDVAQDDFAFCKQLTVEAGVTPIPVSAFYSAGTVTTLARFCFAKQSSTLEEAITRILKWRGRSASDIEGVVGNLGAPLALSSLPPPQAEADVTELLARAY